jgi:hypothetical protein
MVMGAARNRINVSNKRKKQLLKKKKKRNIDRSVEKCMRVSRMNMG